MIDPKRSAGLWWPITSSILGRSSTRAAKSTLEQDLAFLPRFVGRAFGPRCILGQNDTIAPRVVIGVGCMGHNNVSIYEALEDEVFCGPSRVFKNVLAPRDFVERGSEFTPKPVKRDVTNGHFACPITR